MNNVLVKPLITEKAMGAAQDGRYTFVVDKAATKPQIAAAIAQVYGVKVVRVFTITVKGKVRRSGKRRKLVMGPSSKKAIVQLAKGQKIEVFDVTEKQQNA